MAPYRAVLARARRAGTATLTLAHLVLAFAYSQPELSQSPALASGPGRVSIVTYLNGLGPVWLIAYGVTAVWLAAGLLWKPGLLRWGHSVGLAVAATYDVAIWLGFAFSAPPRPTIISAALGLALVGGHVAMSIAYSVERGVVFRTGRHAT